MNFNIKIELEGIRDLVKALEQTPEAFEEGARNGILKVTQDFVKEAKEIAPKKTGKLRKSIKRDSNITGSISKGWIRGTVRAYGIDDNGYDYGAYQEYDYPNESYKKPTTPGTKPHYFRNTLQKNIKEYEKVLSKEMYEALKRKGW